MNFHVLTLFPDMIEAAFHCSITGRAQDRGILELDCVNIRDFAEERRRGRVDDYSYGGGAGMIMQAEPVYRAVMSVLQKISAKSRADEESRTDEEGRPDEESRPGEESRPDEEKAPDAAPDLSGKRVRVLFMSPAGRTFDQKMAEELAKEEDLVFLCGHYEGIDQRVIDEVVTDPVSIGDFVMTGGELPALVMMDAISRMVPGVLTNSESARTESFMGDGLLEYPQYSRPEVWHGRKVPEILMSGNHGAVDRYRRETSLRLTADKRPDLCSGAVLDKKDRKFLRDAGLEKAYEGAKKV